MKITAVKAELHIFDEEVKWKEPLRLQILFADGASLRLSGSGDGEGLVVDRLPLEEAMDMAEYGRTDIFDVTDHLDPTLTAEAVGEPLAIRNPAGKLIGLALLRRDDERFCIWVNGDEFHWGSEAALERDYWPDGVMPPSMGV